MATDPETTKAAIGAAAQLTKDVYADVAQPAARRVGSALDTVFKIGLSPFAMLDAGFELSKVWLEEKVKGRMADTPGNCVISPPNNIAVPALTRIAMSSDAPALRDLYAELLLKAMDRRTAGLVHPAHILLIEQMSSEEAFIFISLKERGDRTLLAYRHSSLYSNAFDGPRPIDEQFGALCKSLNVIGPERSQVWLDNLIRLGLVEIKVQTDAELVHIDRKFEGRETSVETKDVHELVFTAFGRAFREACSPPAETVTG